VLEDDVLSMFRTVVIPPPPTSAINEILLSHDPSLPGSLLDRLSVFHAAFTPEKAASISASPLSLRNLLRVASKASAGGGAPALHGAVRSVLMADLLPQSQQDALDELLYECAIERPDGKGGAAEADTKAFRPFVKCVREAASSEAGVVAGASARARRRTFLGSPAFLGRWLAGAPWLAEPSAMICYVVPACPPPPSQPPYPPPT
jgi:hypothetical protein